jgi:predicted dehydrogenase
VRVLVVGCGHMGAAHARAYHSLPGFELAGVVARTPGPREALAAELGGCPVFSEFQAAFATTRPDAVCVATYPDTHAEMAVASMRGGAAVFVEKPLADSLSAAEQIVSVARETGRTLVVGYILRHHPAWIRYVSEARALGKPLVMRMSQMQPSTGEHWESRRRLMESVSPLVDCGVHYVDVMCQMASGRPIEVQAVGARLAPDLPGDKPNYAQLQLRFDDGSVGSYEVAWGPMVGGEERLLREVMGPAGSATMKDERLPLVELCRREQEFFAESIAGRRDLSVHHSESLLSLRIVLAAERSIRERRVVELPR